MATNPPRMANGTMFFVPPYGANVIQASQIIPGTVIQANGTIQYAGQPPCPPQQNPQVGVLEKMLKVEAKTLGAIQIMIGLMHIGFGAVSISAFNSTYITLAVFGGYPFWGGLFFIISGSLSVSVENHLSKSLNAKACVGRLDPDRPSFVQSADIWFILWKLLQSSSFMRKKMTDVPFFSMVKCSVGMNITSALMALTGVILYISEIIINSISAYTEPVGFGIGTGILFLFFSLLEFCIAVSTAHFGCQAACCHNDTAVVFVPYTVNGGMACAEGLLAPPAYEDPSLK